MSDGIGGVPDEMVSRALDVLGTVGTTGATAVGNALTQGIIRWIAGRVGQQPTEAPADALPDAEQLRELIRAVLAADPELRASFQQSSSSVSVSASGPNSVAVNSVGRDLKVTNRWRFWKQPR
ncbi:hypothetical protein AB0I30_07990 [Nocardia tengchongensis]|uniref:hypothetical protein n=1 Tax=Nocardia tengchongensis TaxID=2055889 RepID=UPI00340AB361